MTLSVRWRRAMLVGTALFCVGLGIALAPMVLALWRARQAEVVSPRVASPQEFGRIVSALFTGIRFEGAPPPPPAPGELMPDAPREPVLLLDETMRICATPRSPEPDCGDIDAADLLSAAHADADLPLQLRRELAAASRTAVGFVCEPTAEVRCAAPRALDALRDEASWWDAFRAAFPATSGLVRISNIVISRDGNQALLTVSHACGETCGTGRLVLLTRAGETWSIARTAPIWFR